MSNSKIGESDRFEEIAVTNWTDNGLFNIPVPSFSITIFHDNEKDSYIGTLCITPPKGKTSQVRRITLKSNNYLSVSHHLIKECYNMCFIPVLTNIIANLSNYKLGEFEKVKEAIRKIIDGCGNELLSKSGGISEILSKFDLSVIATNLNNNMRTYNLHIKTFINVEDNTISNIYAICFEKHNDTTICKVYQLDVGTYKVTLKGGFCYDDDYRHEKLIYKSKLFGDNNEFWEMLLNDENDEFEFTAEYRYFRDVIKRASEFEPNLIGWSSIYFNDEVIYTQNNLVHKSLFDLSSMGECRLADDTGVDSKELSTLLASKLNTIRSYQCYPILISSIFLAADAKKEKEERAIIDLIKSNETSTYEVFGKILDTLYGNGSIDVDEL